MSKFPKLTAPKLTTWMFESLKGLNLPAPSDTHSGKVGLFIDNYIKTQLATKVVTDGVDLADLGIEIKSKAIGTNTDWSIGSMTLEDILSTDYIDSSIYKKLQALLLVQRDDIRQVVSDVSLYYFDIDEVQTLLEQAYTDAKSQIQARIDEHAQDVVEHIRNGNTNAVLEKVKFKNSQRFNGKYGKFEFTNKGNSFVFRISMKRMSQLISIAATQKSPITY